MNKINFLPILFFAIILIVPIYGSANDNLIKCCGDRTLEYNDFSKIENEEEVLKEIVFIEEESEINLGFDTAYYLPHDFDAYAGMQFDLSEIEYIEECDLIDVNADFQKYLPEGFNPYVGQ